MRRKRYRIHPLVASIAMICLTIIAVTAQHYHQNSTLKIIVASIISWLLGVKLRHKLPLT